jgi:hypothetical protein
MSDIALLGCRHACRLSSCLSTAWLHQDAGIHGGGFFQNVDAGNALDHTQADSPPAQGCSSSCRGYNPAPRMIIITQPLTRVGSTTSWRDRGFAAPHHAGESRAAIGVIVRMKRSAKTAAASPGAESVVPVKAYRLAAQETAAPPAATTKSAPAKHRVIPRPCSV